MSENNADPEDTGQISVAELLARNGQKGTNLSSGGRRRRGVKGGISVAELTGEIPIVRAEPASDEAPVIASEPTPRARAKNEPEPELLSGSTTAAADLLNQAHDETERRPYGSTASQRPTPVSIRRSPLDSGSGAEQATATPQTATPQTAGPQTAGPQTGRAQRSSGFVSRSRPRPSEADAEPKTDVTVPAPKEAPTAGKVSTAGKASTAGKVSTAGTTGASAGPASDDADTVSTPDLTKKVVALEKAPASAQSPETTKAPATTKASATTEESTTTKASAASDVATESADIGKSDEAGSGAPSGQRASGKKDAGRQWLGLVGQGVVAVVVGALLFKGFERLWDMLPWVALILAVLVIVGLVAVVRILRRTDDMISMVIAIAVGVFVTLGPLAFQLSTG